MKQNDIFGELLHALSDFLSCEKIVLNGQNLSWTNVHAGDPQGSHALILDPLLFLIYINDLSDNLTSSAKHFADDTSLFSIDHNVNTSKEQELKVNDWAFQWKMSCNPDPSKQAQEVIFSCKSKTPTHPQLVFHNNNISQTFFRKQLGVILDFKVLAKVQQNNRPFTHISKCITKGNANHCIQSFHSA